MFWVNLLAISLIILQFLNLNITCERIALHLPGDLRFPKTGAPDANWQTPPAFPFLQWQLPEVGIEPTRTFVHWNLSPTP